jgi:hypothetical protein
MGRHERLHGVSLADFCRILLVEQASACRPGPQAEACSTWILERNDIRLTKQPHADPADDHHPEITLRWFLRRELVSIPLFAVIVGVLLVFGISVATLLFVFLFAAVILGLVWSR